MKSEKLLMNIAVNKAKTKLKKILQQITTNTKTKILQQIATNTKTKILQQIAAIPFFIFLL